MEPFDIDPGSVRRGAAELEAAKEDVRALFTSFQGALAGFADAFGGDEIGTLVGIAHQACSDAAAECLGTNIVELESYVDALNAMADDLDVTEDGVADEFAAKTRALGG